ncbi:IgGFc-binding protein-like isoform X2 [Ruditapes philippinarum]|uniref:IgGFc-binding protein-like isoform X2 n=1 Tax=Ruditapes philippinarum TaxID=129788 RepID=UPI00295BA79C|nr:IgGFc-binding protein-like isoform X2 [Ruditapes philippinarum]
MFSTMNRVLLLTIILVYSFGQTRCTGSFGRDFYIGVPKAWNNSPQFSLLITSNTAGSATIYIPYLGINTTRSFNQSLEYKVTGDTITNVNTTVEHKGIHVTTDVDVTLTVMKYPTSTWEGFLALPSTMLSSQYIISSGYSLQRYSYNSNFLVLAVHDNTSINVNIDNNTLRVTLNRLDTYLVRRLNDLSGAVVFSNKPVAVFSGHEAGTSQTTCGHLEYFVEQLLPTKHFAQEFIVHPVPPKSQYVVRIYSSSQNTSITFRDTTNQNKQLLLKAGDFYEILSDNGAMYVSANQPVQVMLYGTCKNDANTGNGFMSIVPAINQYRNSYHFSVIATNEPFTHYLTIIAKTEDIAGLRINGNQMGNIFHSYVTHANNETFTVNVYKLSAGEYHLYHVTSRTFGAIQYGFGDLDYAYGYPLGIEVYKESIGNDELRCFDCKDMTHLYLCDTVTKCSSGQVCHVETYRTNSGQVKYNSGCLASEQCSSKKRQTSQSTSECVHCCSSSLCNSNGCGAEGLPPPQLRGPLCYDCSYVSNMDECKTVRLCSKDEVCSVEKYDWGGVYDHYTAKCHNKQCISHKRQTDVTYARESRSTPVCKTCCDADLCNSDCSKTSQNGTDVIIVG